MVRDFIHTVGDNLGWTKSTEAYFFFFFVRKRNHYASLWKLSPGLGARTSPQSKIVGAICAPIFKIFMCTSTRKQLVEQKYASHVLFLGAGFAPTFYLVKINLSKAIKSKQKYSTTIKNTVTCT